MSPAITREIPVPYKWLCDPDIKISYSVKKIINIKFINIIIRDTFSELKVPGNKKTFSNLLITACINPYTISVKSDFFQIILNDSEIKYPWR